MTDTSQKEKAALFRSLHTGSSILVLPNAWDAASAAIFEQAGFKAIATTSSGVAAALGYADGQHIGADLLIESTARIVRVVDCPVTVDIEAGYGEEIEEVLQTVKAVIEVGAVGINIEDSRKGENVSLVDSEFQVELIQAIRQLSATMGIPLVINARTDVFLLGKGNPASHLDEAIRRANIYRQAGADCLFPIGVSNAGLIARLAQEIHGSINILASPATPTIPELAELGVARVSFGGGLLRAVLGHLRVIAQELLEQGTYSSMSDAMLSSNEFRNLFG
jgi:2-methylisocitrate lyase-like PEP mutase family enzyme